MRLVRNDAQWEGRVVEAPTMFKHDGQYVLFFSANDYAGVEYAVGYAICEGPLGPCQDAPENPILASDLSDKNAMVIGPGHQALLQLGDQTWLVYHAEVIAGSRGDRACVNRPHSVGGRRPWYGADGRPATRAPTGRPPTPITRTA